ncbi:hypothetical protein WKH55_22235 [Pantoea agglomerans]|uniref:hypothetical protein n=1 Tax=Enterobacter agglomerans TaxID=549 RepID=UPI003C7C9B95
MTTAYPRIEKMMAGYINMDAYEMTGASDRLGQIRYYTTRVSPKAMAFLLLELDAFELAHKDNLTEDFEEAFDFGADIPDAPAFFELVRQEVTTVLASKKPELSDQNYAPLKYDEHTNIIDVWSLTDAATRLAEIVRSPYVHAYVPRVVKVLHWKDISSGIVKPLSATDVEKARLAIERYRDRMDKPALSVLVEQMLITQARNTPSDMRRSEDYVNVLERLLELKGIDVSHPTPMITHHVDPVEAFILAQERKSTT